jgi:hypothetical protein
LNANAEKTPLTPLLVTVTVNKYLNSVTSEMSQSLILPYLDPDRLHALPELDCHT